MNKLSPTQNTPALQATFETDTPYVTFKTQQEALLTYSAIKQTRQQGEKRLGIERRVSKIKMVVQL